MKYFSLSLLSICITVFSFSQQIEIRSLTIKSPLAPNVTEWQAGDVVATAGNLDHNSPASVVKMVVQVKQNGVMIYGNSAKTGLILGKFNAPNFQVSEMGAALGSCKLEKGSYELCLQFYNGDNHPVSAESCTKFDVVAIEEPKEFTRPVLVSPVNQYVLTKVDLNKPITFIWKPVTPPPPLNNIKYFIRIYAVNAGQDNNQALTNDPILVREVYGTKTEWQLPKDVTDASEFVWTVQGTDLSGKAYGDNNGVSDPYKFALAAGCQAKFTMDSIRCISSVNGVSVYKVCANYKANPSNTFNILFNDPQNASYNLALPANSLSNIIYSYSPGAALSAFVPPLGSLPAVVPPNGVVNVCFTVTTSIVTTTLKIGAFGLCDDGQQQQLHNTANDLDSIAVPKCKCDPCEDMKVTVTNDVLELPKNGNPTQLNLSGVFSPLNANIIKKITAEIIYFDLQQTGDKECGKCAENKQWGNFIPTGVVINGYSGPVLNVPDFSHLATWTNKINKNCDGGVINPEEDDHNPQGLTGGGAAGGGNDGVIPVPGPVKFGLPISIPESSTLSCCKDLVRICIRYTFYDYCCHTCEIVKCYEVRRDNR